ncbi:MAG: ATP-binding protein [Planctomycetota bacterium]
MKARRNFELMAVLAREVTDANDGEQAVHRALSILREGLGAEGTSVFLLNPDRGDVELYALGNEASRLESLRLQRAEGIAGWVIENNRSALVPDCNRDPRFSRKADTLSGYVTRSVLAVPLRYGGAVMGVLEAINPLRGEFDDRDLELLEASAGLLAVSIHSQILHRQREEALEGARRLESMKSSFITMAAHEIFTPLTRIRLQAQLLEEGILGTPSPPQVEGLAKITQSVDDLARIVRDLTNMTLLESGGEALSRKQLILADTLAPVVEEIQGLCLKRSLTFEAEVSPDLPDLWADPRLLQVLVRNLLMNAVRFTPDGGRVGLQLSVKGPDHEILVSDTGIGISRENHETIFQPIFEVADAGHHHSGGSEFGSGGLGLGLSIAKSITQAHGGRIWVESEPGRGSRFYVRLPISPVV